MVIKQPMMPGQDDQNKQRIQGQQVSNVVQPSGEKVLAQPVDKMEEGRRAPHSEAVAAEKRKASSAEDHNLPHFEQVIKHQCNFAYYFASFIV
jgi:hypothetical protein